MELSKKNLMEHYGHNIEVAYYGDFNDPDSVTIECLDCYEVLAEGEDNEFWTW